MTADSTPERSDRELVVLASHSATRTDALRAIYERYYGSVLRYTALQLNEKDNVLDAAQDTFADLVAHFNAGDSLDNPDALPGFIRTMARRRAMTYMRGGSSGKGHRSKLDPLTIGEWPDIATDSQEILRAEDDLGVARVRALLDDSIVPTLTPRQQNVYEYSVRRQLTGQDLADELGVTPDQAKRSAGEVKDLTWRAFAAFALYTSGGGKCAELDDIIAKAVAANGRTFTRALREEIVRHFDDCVKCRNCPTCGPLQRRIVARYAPVLIPILLAAELRDRTSAAINRVDSSSPLEPDQNSEPGAQHSGLSRRDVFSRAVMTVVVIAIIVATLVISRRIEQSGPSQPGAHASAAISTPTAATFVPSTPTRTIQPSLEMTDYFAGNNSFAVNPDGKTLAVATGFNASDGQSPVQIRDMATGQVVSTLSTNRDDVSAVAISPDGKTLAVGGGSAGMTPEGFVQLWNLQTSTLTRTLDTAYTVRSLVFSADGQTLAGGGPVQTGWSDSGGVTLWNLADGTPVQIALPSNFGQVYSVALSPDEKTLAVAGGDGVHGSTTGYVVLWDRATQAVSTRLTTSGNIVYSVAFNHDATLLATSSNSVNSGTGSVQLWNATTGAPIATLIQNTGSGGLPLAFGTDANTLVTSIGDQLEIWNTATRQSTAILTTNAAADGFESDVFGPDGKTIAALSNASDPKVSKISLWRSG